MNSRQIMIYTLLALLPGTLACTWFFGFGVLANLMICFAAAVTTDFIVNKLRDQDWQLDYASLLTAALLALCLPPLLPFWMAGLASVFALVFGKHIYGGTGHNVFNPAMVGYAMLIVSFPLAMSFWPAEATNQPGLVLETKSTLTQGLPEHDAVSSATPLDEYKFREAMTNAEYFGEQAEANFSQWMTINVGFLLGGILLIYMKIVSWRVPATFLATIGVLSIVFYDSGSSASLGSPLFHWLSGGTMLAAFFIITDPVSRPTYPLGILVFAAGVGLITFIIRTIGGYPDGIAFAVLLMNAASPLIDHFLQRREVTVETA
ncbi:MAG: RnfABCDGE type electron transport complex subunit D [Pseudomonadales bacterium]|nr:RnfABCDGE type electron transport complex subunit D [Pseudomonadales bacterium]MBO6596069.1 RnfABCDGE type electron transport complex subunit D [Pseudomonadales bacterium]MBO6822552.1 RnfABCDGE type electron transport complex subunit D [Pseudomonadales bacterium]